MTNGLNSGMYWMMSGLPYMMSLPTVGSKSSGRWDGSKWVRGNNTSSTSSLPSAMASNHTEDKDTTFGANNFSGPSGYSGAFSSAALGSAAIDSAANTLGSTLGDIGKNAAVSGVLGGLATGNFGSGLAAALGSAANPGTFANALGSLTNSAFGLSGVPNSLMGIAAGIMGAINPGLGLATSVFGGFALDGLMDAFNARSYEQVRDLAEGFADDYFGGRIAGATLANDFDMAKNNPAISNYAPTVAMSLASLGAVPTANMVADFTAAGFADFESPAIAAALGELSIDAMSPAQMAAMQSLGLDAAHAQLNSPTYSLNELGGITGVGGPQVDGTLTSKEGWNNVGVFGGISIDPATGMAYSNTRNGFGYGQDERKPTFDIPNLATPPANPQNPGISSGQTAADVTGAISAGIDAAMGALGGDDSNANTGSPGAEDSSNDDGDSGDTGNDNDGSSSNDGGGDGDGPSGSGGMSGGSGIGGHGGSDDSDADSDGDGDSGDSGGGDSDD